MNGNPSAGKRIVHARKRPDASPGASTAGPPVGSVLPSQTIVSTEHALRALSDIIANMRSANNEFNGEIFRLEQIRDLAVKAIETRPVAPKGRGPQSLGGFLVI